MSDVYARDIAEEKLNDAFFGKGFEKLLKEAEEKGVDVVVGKFYKKPYIIEK